MIKSRTTNFANNTSETPLSTSASTTLSSTSELLESVSALGDSDSVSGPITSACYGCSLFMGYTEFNVARNVWDRSTSYTYQSLGTSKTNAESRIGRNSE
jgi:hypothetical protein